MTLREYIKTLQAIARENPKALNHTVIYSADDEGNYFEPVHYHPAACNFDGERLDMAGEKENNAVCIN